MATMGRCPLIECLTEDDNIKIERKKTNKTSKIKTTSRNVDNPENQDDLKNLSDPKHELRNEENLM